jgi:hypothetical protein
MEPHTHYLRNPRVPQDDKPGELMTTDGSDNDSEYEVQDSSSSSEEESSEGSLESENNDVDKSGQSDEAGFSDDYDDEDEAGEAGDDDEDEAGDDDDKAEAPTDYKDLTEPQIAEITAQEDGENLDDDDSDVLSFENPDLDNEEIDSGQYIDRTDPIDLPDQQSRDAAFILLTNAAQMHLQTAQDYDHQFQILNRAYQRHSVVTNNIFYKYILIHWREKVKWNYNPTREEMAVHKEQKGLFHEIA